MKASTLKRPAEIEQVADRASMQPLVLIDVLTFDPADRDAYWSGDDGVLTRYGGRDGIESKPGMILYPCDQPHPKSPEGWLTTRDMDEDELESFEQRQIHEEQRREREAAAERERLKVEAMNAARVRHNYAGYPIS